MYRSHQPALRPSVLIVALLGLVFGVAWFLGSQPPTPQAQPGVTPETADSALPGPTTEPQPAAEATDWAERPLQILFIPDLGVYTPIVELPLEGKTWNVAALGRSAGHLEGTPWFDVSGNHVLSGHVEMTDGTPGAFAEIHRLQAGDEVIVRLEDGDHWYRVTGVKTVEPTDLTVLYPTEADTLTLLTCAGYDFLTNTYTTRVAVTAERLT